MDLFQYLKKKIVNPVAVIQTIWISEVQLLWTFNTGFISPHPQNNEEVQTNHSHILIYQNVSLENVQQLITIQT